MKALIFETSCEKSCLILAENGSVRKKKFLSGGSELSKTLARETDLLLKSDPGPVDFIAVGHGPGSYTGTRVGAALAKGLSFGWKVPLYGFCSLIAFAPETQEGPFSIVVDARMGGFYILSGERKGASLTFSAPQLVKLQDAAALLEKTPLFSPHPSEILKRLPGLRVEERDPNAALIANWVFSSEFLPPLELTYLSCP